MSTPFFVVCLDNVCQQNDFLDHVVNKDLLIHLTSNSPGTRLSAHLWIFSLSQTLSFFSCCLSCMSTHFPSSSPGTPGQTFNRLKRDWDLFIELGKQQKVLLVHVFPSVFCFCAKHVGQVRFFGVFMPISRWQVNRDLKIHILCGVPLISTMPNLCVDVVLKRSFQIRWKLRF